MEKKWFKEEKDNFFQKKSKKPKKEFTDDKLLKTALTLPLVVGGIVVGTKLLKSVTE